MAATEDEGEREYAGYLTRFEAIHGPVELGTFVKQGGRLVKKLRLDEFAALYAEYYDVARHYFTSIDRGDTINDVAVKVLRERASELFLTSPV